MRRALPAQPCFWRRGSDLRWRAIDSGILPARRRGAMKLLVVVEAVSQLRVVVAGMITPQQPWIWNMAYLLDVQVQEAGVLHV